MDDYGVKKIGGRVRVTRGPGMLRISIRNESNMQFLAHAVLFPYLLWSFLPRLIGSVPGLEPAAMGISIGLAALFCAFSLSRFFLDGQILEVWQGVFRVHYRVSIFARCREAGLHEIKDLALNIPEGKNHPGYVTIPKGGRLPRGSISFRYNGELVEIAPGVDRLAATYILNELRKAGLNG